MKFIVVFQQVGAVVVVVVVAVVAVAVQRVFVSQELFVVSLLSSHLFLFVKPASLR